MSKKQICTTLGVADKQRPHICHAGLIVLHSEIDEISHR